MNITGPASSPAKAVSPGESAAKSADAQAWRQAMLNQILTQVRRHEPEVSQAAKQAGAPPETYEPSSAPPRKGSLVNRYV